MYDFKQLSPADLEELARDLLQKHWNVHLESFKSGRDRGIDLRYASVPGEAIIVQCKHFAGSSVAKLVSELRIKEIPKIVCLAPKRYILVTSLALNPNDKDKIRKAVSPYIVATDDVFGAEDLNNLLGRFPAVETQHFKLWMSSSAVLQRVIHNAEQVQTEFDVDRVRRAIPLYVQTSNYSRALKILEEFKFLIISGVPGIGKTTLADMLLFTHLESAYQPVVIKSEISEGRKLFAPERRQVFYFDDFLGETFLGNRFDFLGKKEDSALLDFIEIISRSKHGRLILTSREHILRHAFQISDHFRRRRSALADSRCIIELDDYTLLDRGRILYNHIYFSDLPDPFKIELLRGEFYLEILKHRNFNPRLVEWLSRFTNMRKLSAADYQKEVGRVLENPEQLWRIAFEQQISEGSRSLLLALYSLGGEAHLKRLEDAWKPLHEYRARRHNWKTAAEDWRRALQDLEGGFLAFDGGLVGFVNPSVRDFLDTTLVLDVEHVADMLAAACFFEQVVNVWSLARSEKGGRLQDRLGESPSSLFGAIRQNLAKPYERHVSSGNVMATLRMDVRPEVRLQTLLSIADQTRSEEALETINGYARDLVEFWAGNTPDFKEAVSILRSFDAVRWNRLADCDLHGRIKGALLHGLTQGVQSGAFYRFSGYAQENGARWNAEDQKALIGAFRAYLDADFDREIIDYSSPGELEEFSEMLGSIASHCGIKVASFRNEIQERINEMADHEEDDDRPIREWESLGKVSGGDPEADVRQLFSGLDFSSVSENKIDEE